MLFPGALGDFVCFLPALSELARQAGVRLLARAEFAEIVPSGVTVESLERHEISRLFAPEGENDPRVRDFFSRFMAVLSWFGAGEEEFARRLAAAAGGRARFFAFRPADGQTHMSDYYLSCIAREKDGKERARVEAREKDRAAVAAFWSREGLTDKAVLVVAPGSGSAKKNWDLARFEEVAREWRGRRNREAVFLLGPVEDENGSAAALSREFLALRGWSLGKVVALFERARLFLGNDSGVAHLAAAVGTPTVALFGPSDPRVWGPRGDHVRIVRLGVACSPCDPKALRRCGHRMCLALLHPQSVLEIIEEHIRSTARAVADTCLDKGGPWH